MGLLSLTREDLDRVTEVFKEQFGTQKAPGFRQLRKLLKDYERHASAHEPDPGFVGFSNPPAPSKSIADEGVAMVFKFRQALADKYGQEYVDDLWARWKS